MASVLLSTVCIKAQVTSNYLLQNKTPDLSVTSNGIDIYIFGNGGIRSAATNENQNNTNSLSGALGVTFLQGKKTEFTLGYSVNDFTTISISNTNEYGSNILVPDLSGRSFSATITHFVTDKIAGNIEFQLADSNWEFQDTTFESSPLSFKLNAVFAPFGNLVEGGDNFITVAFTAGYSLRSLIGNIKNQGEILKTTFGTDKTSFSGIELGVSLVVNQTKVFFNVPILKSAIPVDGLSGAQAVIGATVTGEFLKFNSNE